MPDFRVAVSEIARILQPNGLLLLGLPFAQGLHCEPTDFWRFTKYGIEEMLKDRFDVLEIKAILGDNPPSFPKAYWTLAERKLS